MNAPQTPKPELPQASTGTPALYQTPAQQKWTREQAQLNKFITGFSGSLTGAGGGDNGAMATLPEKIFVEYFLPFFVGDPRCQEANGGVGEAKMLNDWVMVAGGPMHRVNITDPTGKVLFTVPAIAATSFIDPMRKDNDITFREIVTMAGQYTLLSPTMGENYSTEALMAKFQNLYRKDMTVGVREGEWLAIFHRYASIIPRDLIQAAAAPGTPAAPTASGYNEAATDF